MRRAILLGLLVVLPSVAATAQNDLGLGGDASDEARFAIEPPGIGGDGVVLRAEGDAADWYQIFIPQGDYLFVWLSTAQPLLVRLADASGGTWKTWRVAGSTSGHYELTIDAPPPDARIGILPDAGSPDTIAYHLELHRRQRPDLAVTAVWAEPSSVLGVTFPTSYVGYARVLNHGLATTSVRVDGWTSPVGQPTASARWIESGYFNDLAPGQEAVIDVHWGIEGEVGEQEVTLVAHVATGPAERSTNDNAGSARYVALTSTPIGLDLLHHRAGVDGVASVCVDAWVDLRPPSASPC